MIEYNITLADRTEYAEAALLNYYANRYNIQAHIVCELEKIGIQCKEPRLEVNSWLVSPGQESEGNWPMIVTGTLFRITLILDEPKDEFIVQVFGISKFVKRLTDRLVGDDVTE